MGTAEMTNNERVEAIFDVIAYYNYMTMESGLTPNAEVIDYLEKLEYKESILNYFTSRASIP